MKTVISLFRYDNQYSFDDVEHRLLTDDAPFDMSPTTDVAVRAEIMRNSAATVNLFALEKLSKSTFDPLALSDYSLYVDLERCIARC